ncbi:MAG: hypothetical protein ACJAV5_001371 [Vicingaceae bacterium]|jgi:hypothetical protein
MIKLYTLLTAVIITTSAFAQAPEKMSYQAVVRDTGNTLLSSQVVGMQLSILQGSVSGLPVYVETQTPGTNINGLVSIEIGYGTVVSGTFNTIDWSAGPYFIKTETDPTGGATYTITGTSQLMSVPYALHANTADSIAGGVIITETDPVFGTSIANGITALDTANWNNHTVDTDTQLDSTGVAALGYVANKCNLSIGDTFQGGIVYYLGPSGCHGLIAAPTDTMGQDWREGATNVETKAYGTGLFEGRFNTELIMSAQRFGTTSAAAICYNLVLGGQDDWYLPSIYELELLNQNIGFENTLGLGNIANLSINQVYWSSTEVSLGATYLLFADLNLIVQPISKASGGPIPIRAIRAF